MEQYDYILNDLCDINKGINLRIYKKLIKYYSLNEEIINRIYKNIINYAENIYKKTPQIKYIYPLYEFTKTQKTFSDIPQNERFELIKKNIYFYNVTKEEINKYLPKIWKYTKKKYLRYLDPIIFTYYLKKYININIDNDDDFEQIIKNVNTLSFKYIITYAKKVSDEQKLKYFIYQQMNEYDIEHVIKKIKSGKNKYVYLTDLFMRIKQNISELKNNKIIDEKKYTEIINYIIGINNKKNNNNIICCIIKNLINIYIYGTSY